MMKNDCEGCVTVWHIRLGKECLCSVTDNCPCLHCLVKVVCVNMCDALGKHIKKSRRWMSLNRTEET